MPRPLPPPPLTDPAELVAYSDEHLVYEIQMFLGARQSYGYMGLIERTDESSSFTTTRSHSIMGGMVTSKFEHNARVEAFVLHLRNLVAFLFPDAYTPYSDDVVAHHFLSDVDPYSAWLAVRPPLSNTLRDAKTRADKELAHLTSKRVPGSTKNKSWNTGPLIAEVRPLLDTFVTAADPKCLAPSVAAELRQ